MYTIMECAKLGLFVLALLTGIIFCLEGCLSTKVTVIHDEIPCIMTQTNVDILPGKDFYDRTVIDCSAWDEDGNDGTDTDTDSGDQRGASAQAGGDDFPNDG
jgi:hypothetical protein